MKQLRRIEIKRMTREAFDNLPSGVCFFDGNGVLTLCNRQMHRLIFDLTGKDLQSLFELEAIMSGEPKHGTRNGEVFTTEAGVVWRFSRERVKTAQGDEYTQVVAADVTELTQKQKELERDNLALEELGARLRRLSANITAVTREEEILSMKMRVHDDIGRSVIATRRLLRQERPTSELELEVWKNAIRLLKRDNESTGDSDALAQLIDAAAGIGVEIELDGTLPDYPEVAYLLITAMRECATNAARHARATKMFVKLSSENGIAAARIENNGDAPEGPITEGGGLSSLRARVEKAGGWMRVRSAPRFELTVRVPVKAEERL